MEAEGRVCFGKIVDGLCFTCRKRPASLEIVGGEGLDGRRETVFVESGKAAGRGGLVTIVAGKDRAGKAQAEGRAKQDLYHKRYFPKIRDFAIAIGPLISSITN